ncbi:MAG: hypothetical protein E7017_03135 [Alphaproteobacteria bacterium]|nr:hypothetical protein [Alphaproteobacteria bacterium]
MAEEINIDIESFNRELEKLNSIEDINSFSAKIYDLLANENTPDNLTEKLQEIISKAENKRDETYKSTSDNNKQQESEEVAATPNSQDHDEFKKAKNNEERRKIVKKEFLTGELTHQEHIDFFIEQFAKNQLGIDKENEETRSKLENILGGKEGILQRRETLLKSIVSNSLNTYTTTASGMAPVIGKDDFGLSVAKDDVTKKSNKTEFDGLMAEADRLALLKRELGTERKEDVAKREEILRKNLKEFQSGEKKLKWYQFRRQRRLNKADEKLDPIRYWNEQRQHNGDSLYVQFMHSRAIWRAKKRTNNTEKYKEKLNNVIEAKAIDASIGWFSKRVGKKIKAKTTILFSRSPEKLLEKFKQNATVSDMAEYQKELQAKLTSKKESYNPDIYTTSERAEQEQYTKYYGGFAEKLEEAAKQKRNDVDNLEKGMKGTKHSSDKPEMVVGNLKSKLEQVKRSFEQAEKDDIVLKAWNNFHDANSNETGKFSDTQILQIICEQSGFENIDGLLRSMGIPENKVSELKEQILGKSSEQKPVEQDAPHQQSGDENIQETTSAKVRTVDNVLEGSKQVAETDFYQSSKNEYVYNKQAVSGGENPLASKTDHIKTLLTQLKTQGVKDIEITGFDDSMAKAFKDVLESDEFKDDFNVTNKEQLDEQVKNAEKVDESHDKNDDKKVGGETPEETLEEVVLGQGREEQDKVKVASETDKESQDSENGEKENRNDDKFQSFEEVQLSVASKGDKAAELLKVMNDINTGHSKYTAKELSELGFDKKETAYLADLSTAQELEEGKSSVEVTNEASERGTPERGKQWTDEDFEVLQQIKSEEGIKTSSDKSFEKARAVADSFATDEVDTDNAEYKSLSSEEQQIVNNLCKLRKDVSEKCKDANNKKIGTYSADDINKARNQASKLVAREFIKDKFEGKKHEGIDDKRTNNLSKEAISKITQQNGSSRG